MNYKSKFELDFMSRSREIIEQYQGPYDATLLINCMLGLLVVPKETLFSDIPLIPFESSSFPRRLESIVELVDSRLRENDGFDGLSLNKSVYVC